MDVNELKMHFHKGKANAYAWPGGYPLAYLCSDGGTLCPKCVTDMRTSIFRSVADKSSDGWQVVAVFVNWEDATLFCDHCGKRIESAYAEDETETEESL